MTKQAIGLEGADLAEFSPVDEDFGKLSASKTGTEN